jgi:hypothetical protein
MGRFGRELPHSGIRGFVAISDIIARIRNSV